MRSLQMEPWIGFTATATSAVSAVVGMGGGAALLAFLAQMHLSHVELIGVHGAIQWFGNGFRGWVLREHIHWDAVGYYGIACLPGPLIGLLLLHHIPASYAKAAIGLMLVFVVWVRPGRGWYITSARTGYIIAGFLSGALGPWIGAVGPVMAPFFLHPSLRKEAIVATKATCTLIAHTVKVAALTGAYSLFSSTHSRLDWNSMHLRWILAGITGTIIGTLLGKRFLYRIRSELFFTLYRGVLLLLASKLIFDAFDGYI